MLYKSSKLRPHQTLRGHAIAILSRRYETAWLQYAPFILVTGTELHRDLEQGFAPQIGLILEDFSSEAMK